MSDALLLASFIGQHGHLSIDGLKVLVEVTDSRWSYGIMQFQVTPIGGFNTKWVQADRVKLDPNGSKYQTSYVPD